eukprot:GHVL01011878.1.p1 GENE.GHVL01011878.1~~GHVL01011878.1.p1  ORF type:complete len:141 (+),score=28.36 GHVL01011878.1:343-765(+)
MWPVPSPSPCGYPVQVLIKAKEFSSKKINEDDDGFVCSDELESKGAAFYISVKDQIQGNVNFIDETDFALGLKHFLGDLEKTISTFDNDWREFEIFFLDEYQLSHITEILRPLSELVLAEKHLTDAENKMVFIQNSYIQS